MAIDMTGKTILITGASSGLGKAVAGKFAAEGTKLILISNDQEELEVVNNELRDSGCDCKMFVCDISDYEEVKNTLGQITSEYKNIDIVVNNAGLWTDDNLEKTRPELRKQTLEVNTLGHIQFIEEILPYLKKQKHAHIFNVISTSAVVGIPEGNNSMWKTYGASKWAMAGYTNALRESLSNTKIKVSGFFPGGFDSNLYETAGRDNPHNQPWMMKTDDVADVIIFALTRPSDVLIQSIVVTKF